MNKFLSWFCYIFLKPIVKLIWIKEVRGIENIPKSNFILTSNHQSHWDQVTNAYLCVPRKFTYLGQIDKYTGFEKFLRNLFYKIAGVIPIHRFQQESIKKAIEECIFRLKKGEILIVYPEGTRTRTGEIQEPKKGWVKIYLKTGIPILPVAIKGNSEVMPIGKRFPKFKKVVRINVGRPLEFKEELLKAKGLDPNSKEYHEICVEIAQRVIEEIKNLYAQL